MKNLQRLLLATFAAVVLMATTIGCKHTAHGAGQDIEKMGEKIKDKTE